MRTLQKNRKRFKNTLTAKILNKLYKITKIEKLDNLYMDLLEKYYEV